MSSATQPVITYSGDLQLFRALEPQIVKALPQESVEWKRSYGRPPRAVTLSASFIHYKPDVELTPEPPKQPKRLSNCKVLHTYWIECPDIDTYKSTVRDSIQAWFNRIKQAESSDWLVVIVETADSKKANKILPRTTVLDKLKSDYGGKTPERCLSVTDPSRNETKTTESWQTFMFRLRQALMAAYSRTLSKFEETIRTQRERRNEMNWNFCNYFLLQEELAFAFEVLGLYDEALVQYDELDALFTQFVLNSAVGEVPKWLIAFQSPPNNWSGVCLNSTSCFNAELRKKIQEHKMSVIDFRNYLFARQAALLLVSNKPFEVARRCLSNVQNFTYELKLLGVNTVDGAVPSWILLTCLQVLSACQSQMASAGSAANQSMESFALLWNVAKDKLYELGRMCGLLPGHSVGSEELHSLVTILSGIVDFEDEPHDSPTPVDKFKDALSTSQAFTNQYLELSELAMGTFKHCGRLRSARMIGRDLARFYVQLNQPQKAVSFLIDLLRGYQEENWPKLRLDTHIELADVYLQAGDIEKFLEAAAMISSYSSLEKDLKTKYFTYIKNPPSGERITISAASIIKVNAVKIEFDERLGDESVLCDTNLKARIEITNSFPESLNCDEILVTLKRLENPNNNTKASTQKKISADETNRGKPEQAENVQESSSSLPDDFVIIKEQHHLKQDGSLSSVTLVCPNTHQVLGRKISHGIFLYETVSKNEDFSQKLSVKNVMLEPGINHFTLEMKADTEGTYVVHQFVAQSNRIELVQNIECNTKKISVVDVLPSITIGKTPEDLLAGVEQSIDLIIRTGSKKFDEEMNLKLGSSRGLMIRLAEGDGEFQRELDLRFGPIKAFETATYKLIVLADLNFTTSKDATSVEHNLSITCPWSVKTRPVMDLPLFISAPFTVHYKLLTANTRKFVNIYIQGLTESGRSFLFKTPEITLSENVYKNPSLSKLELKNVNCPDQILTICQKQSANYLWELCGIPHTEEVPGLKVEFIAQYCQKESSDWRRFFYNFELMDYVTLFTVRSRVDPIKGNDFLRAGALCHMTLTFNEILSRGSASVSLMYEVLADQALWAVCGRTAGVFSMEGTRKHSVTFEVMPLVSGYLPLPSVRLSRYIPAEQKTRDASRKPELGITAASLPRLEPFSPGQIYNWSKAQQVHVLAAPNTGGPSSLDTSMS